MSSVFMCRRFLVGIVIGLAAPAIFAGPDGALKFTRISNSGSTAWVSPPSGTRIPTTDAAPFVVEFWVKLAEDMDSVSELHIFNISAEIPDA